MVLLLPPPRLPVFKKEGTLPKDLSLEVCLPFYNVRSISSRVVWYP
jgi:hypothetical protein